MWIKTDEFKALTTLADAVRTATMTNKNFVKEFPSIVIALNNADNAIFELRKKGEADTKRKVEYIRAKRKVDKNYARPKKK